ncbi:electron transfer flavoprotein subunit alpha/FixB family protein [Paraburkholderia dipogonis]|uniref:Electron transfer flavoprotein subunit alpha/FixB family protein n=1 Tax=Paraburkholderia dipogonis TaxID=1211383 RepID=A0A4Y8MKX0_9BURK|nr:electron transfer flavoprotein subunit alpha/FixB family protein [Paraburkholderia dipogonis]TFE38082.1 electron transfer flavoprotein subunit alpha/FixB family protein [Paraburkholderia dipogonis]
MSKVNVIVVCEAGVGQTESANASLVAAASKLARSQGGRVCALLIGNQVAAVAAELASYGVEVRVADAPQHTDYNPSVYLNELNKLIEAINPGAILAAHTYLGMDLAPRLAAKLKVAFATNCIDVNVEDGDVCFTRPMYRGRLIAKVALDTTPLVATMQQSGAKPEAAIETGTVVAVEASAGADNRVRPIRTIVPESSGVDIAKADIVVSGGRGLGEQKNYALIEELADAVGGVPACSRPLVDMGWLTVSSQVGLSGKTVKPKLYIACGISGAVEHVYGMKEAGVVVAINKDPEAPIFKTADIGVIGDVLEIIPKLTSQVKSVRA